MFKIGYRIVLGFVGALSPLSSDAASDRVESTISESAPKPLSTAKAQPALKRNADGSRENLGVVACTPPLYAGRRGDPPLTEPHEAVAADDNCEPSMSENALAEVVPGPAPARAARVERDAVLAAASIEAEPALLALYDVPTMQRLFRGLRYAGKAATLTKLQAKLIETGYGKDDPEFFGNLAIDAAATYALANQPERIVPLLPQILNPEIGLRMLIDRRFAAVWPAIEEWSDGTLVSQRDANVAAAKAHFAIHDTLDNRRIYATTLWVSGKRNEAQSLLRSAINNPTAWDSERIAISRLTVSYARMLMKQGKADEAIAVAGKVNAANPIARFPYAANLMPNLAYMLIAAKRFAEALALIDREYPPRTAVESGSSFGYYAVLRYCAYRSLGRSAEAAGQAVLLTTKFTSNEAALAIRKSCDADITAVRGDWLGRFADPSSRDAALLSYLRIRIGIGIAEMDSSTLRDDDQFVRTDSALHDAFLRFGRELPESYLPALKGWADSSVK